MEVLGSKASIKAWAKKQYTIMKLFYQRTPEWTSTQKVYFAETNLFAGIHNQNRALFEKGLRDWKTNTMACFDEFENDENLTLALHGEGVFEHHTKKEGALFALGEHIKNKRNDYEDITKQLDEMNWWA
jgi:hypothetical protein